MEHRDGENGVQVNGQLNMGTVVAVLLFLTAQSIAAVYWGGAITTQLSDLQEDFTDFREQMLSEQLRQWDRINDNEDSVSRLEAQNIATTAVLKEINDDLDLVHQDIRTLNANIRSLIEQIGEVRNGD